jgi:hypothetical protein
MDGRVNWFEDALRAIAPAIGRQQSDPQQKSRYAVRGRANQLATLCAN